MKKRVCNSRLKYERQLHNWSQQKVADMIGSTVVNVSRWERGATSFGVSSVTFLTKMPLC
jgi:transcriptional regulator with XRE-family HTH domain